jgi:WhiB family redox-sensing transcriptional regulator
VTVASADKAWRLLAACRDSPAALFLPPKVREPAAIRSVRESAAKDICSQCRVRDECLAYALRVPEPFGVWGGLTELERRRLTPSKAD